MFHPRLMRATSLLGLALVSGACGKNADSSGDAEVPEVSAAEVPDVAGGESQDADRRELARYQLSMANVRKWMAANERMRKIAQGHPELDQDDDTASTGKLESFDEMEARFERQVGRVPGGRRAFEHAGLSVREYLLIFYALANAWGAQLAIQQGATPDSAARGYGIHPANLRFVKQHEAELEKVKQFFQESG